MSIGNQRTRPNQTSNRASDPLVSPISTDDMGEFLGLGLPLSVSDAALIDGLLLAACQYYIDYSNNELLQRNYIYKADSFPRQQESFTGLGRQPGSLAWWLSFPIWPVDSITTVADSDGPIVLPDYTVDYDSKPSRLELSNPFVSNLQIDYLAGYATAADIPPSVLIGIQMLTAYLYEHRGSCDAASAASDSGALVLWNAEIMYLTL